MKLIDPTKLDKLVLHPGICKGYWLLSQLDLQGEGLVHPGGYIDNYNDALHGHSYINRRYHKITDISFYGDRYVDIHERLDDE